MARLWGDDKPIFENEAQINAVRGAVMIHYNSRPRMRYSCQPYGEKLS